VIDARLCRGASQNKEGAVSAFLTLPLSSMSASLNDPVSGRKPCSLGMEMKSVILQAMLKGVFFSDVPDDSSWQERDDYPRPL
jgi:hypothetical protein